MVSKSTGRKKKASQQKSIETNKQNVVEPPQNLLPEHTQTQEETPVNKEVVEEEVKTITEEKKETPVSVEVKPDEIKSEEILKATESSPPPPPVSVSVSGVEPPSPPDQPSNRKFVWIGLSVLLICLAAFGVWMYLSNKPKPDEKKTEAATPTKSTTEKPEPTATSSAKISLDKYSIKVLNGSGIPGEASRLQDLLEKGGFEVGEVSNAQSYDYTDTIIQAKKAVEKIFLEKLRTLVGKSYVLGKDEPLASTSSSDVIVIVGNKKAEK